MAGRDLAPEANESMDAVARRRLRGRNFALLGLLGAVVLIFYVLTFVIMGGQGS
jgi:hypothetical protein